MPFSKIKYVEKGWGNEKWIVNCPEYCGKILFFNKGKRCSCHYHLLKYETFYIQSGRIHLFYGQTDDLNQSYTSSSISILAGHLVQKPIDSAVLTSSNFAEQYAFFVMDNGSMAVFHSIREEETRGWSCLLYTSDAADE